MWWSLLVWFEENRSSKAFEALKSLYALKSASMRWTRTTRQGRIKYKAVEMVCIKYASQCTTETSWEGKKAVRREVLQYWNQLEVGMIATHYWDDRYGESVQRSSECSKVTEDFKFLCRSTAGQKTKGGSQKGRRSGGPTCWLKLKIHYHLLEHRIPHSKPELEVPRKNGLALGHHWSLLWDLASQRPRTPPGSHCHKCHLNPARSRTRKARG